MPKPFYRGLAERIRFHRSEPYVLATLMVRNVDLILAALENAPSKTETAILTLSEPEDADS